MRLPNYSLSSYPSDLSSKKSSYCHFYYFSNSYHCRCDARPYGHRVKYVLHYGNLSLHHRNVFIIYSSFSTLSFCSTEGLLGLRPSYSNICVTSSTPIPIEVITSEIQFHFLFWSYQCVHRKFYLLHNTLHLHEPYCQSFHGFWFISLLYLFHC